jgi:hypothetical protein
VRSVTDAEQRGVGPDEQVAVRHDDRRARQIVVVFAERRLVQDLSGRGVDRGYWGP